MEEQNVYVELRKLPSFSALNEKVKAVEKSATWWDMYGAEWMHIAGATLGAGVGLLLLRDGGVVNSLLGVLLLGVFHSVLTQRAGHLAAHNALVRSKPWNKFWAVTMVEFLGGYSEFMGTDIHIRQHHPHTNIIGLGDSSSWKIPGIPGLVYLYAAPLALPPLAPLVATHQLVEIGAYRALARFVPVVVGGVVLRALLFIHVSGYSVLGALLIQWAYMAVFAIPYIHFNVFQHIGLPMYSQEKRPARIYQMATGVLNLDRNPILDLVFGHALINCHVEHHLFPRLSDSMCLKVKPLVRQYLLDNGLPYNEGSYWDRLCTFTKGYEQLMVKAPPITHFIGLQ